MILDAWSRTSNRRICESLENYTFYLLRPILTHAFLEPTAGNTFQAGHLGTGFGVKSLIIYMTVSLSIGVCLYARLSRPPRLAQPP